MIAFKIDAALKLFQNKVVAQILHVAEQWNREDSQIEKLDF